MRTPPPALLPLLRSQLVGQLLGLLLNDADRQWRAEELAAQTGSAYPTVTKEIRRLEVAGIVTTATIGRTKLLRANRESSFFRPLSELIELSFGVPLVLADEFSSVSGIGELFIFGPWAARVNGESGALPDNIDVLVVGRPESGALAAAVARAQDRLRRTVSLEIATVEQWSSGRNRDLARIRASQLLPIPNPSP